MMINQSNHRYIMSRQPGKLDLPSLKALQELGDRLRILRILRNDTIGQMAERLQCSPATYAALEKGVPTSQIGLLVKAMTVLGVVDSLAMLAPVSVELMVANPAVRKRVRSVKRSLPTDSELDF
jgi:transcriptional regulator with XRE-family HTH domain